MYKTDKYHIYIQIKNVSLYYNFKMINMKQKFKKPRTLKDLKNDQRVDDIWHENEGFDNNSSWWCYLKPGWEDSMNPTCTSIHEATLKEVCHLVHNAKRIKLCSVSQ